MNEKLFALALVLAAALVPPAFFGPAPEASAVAAQPKPPVTPAAVTPVPAVKPATTTATPAPRAGGFPMELALPALASGAAAIGGGVYLLRRGKKQD